MGRNKALIKLDGAPLAARVLAALQPLTAEQLIVANDPAPYRFLHRPIIPDIEPGYGPLMGLYSGLKAASNDLAVAVAVDMPFLTSDFLRALLNRASGWDVVIPETAGRLHPLCAVYRRATCLPAIEEAIARGQRRLIAFHPQVRVQRVQEADLRSISPDLRELINVNTPQELAEARGLFGAPERNFFEKVWLITRQIPRGQVTWYGHIAEMLEAPGAARTVGWALSALTPEQSRLIPWQRVINKAGRCSIRSAGRTPDHQQSLLEAEGVLFDARGYTDFGRFGWDGLTPDEVRDLIANARLPWE